MRMHKFTFVLVLTFITLAALILVLFWALPPLLTPLLYLHPTDWTDADIVKANWHFRLVDPEWVSAPPDYMRWSLAETLARLVVVFLNWLTSVALVIRRYKRRKGPSPNQTPQCTGPASNVMVG
jgi:hypothetical protein